MNKNKKSFHSVSWMTPVVGIFALLALVTTSILTHAKTPQVVDFAIVNVARPHFGKVKSVGLDGKTYTLEQLRFEINLTSDSEIKESIYFNSECYDTSSRETLALSFGIQDLAPGRSKLKRVVPVADVGKKLFQNIKKKQGSFTCDFDLPGYFPAEMADDPVTTAQPDADMSNNFFRTTVQWQGKKLKIISTTRTR